jgi:hypothetical protein
VSDAAGLYSNVTTTTDDVSEAAALWAAADNVGKDGGPKNLFDPDNGYRNQYKAIWGRK